MTSPHLVGLICAAVGITAYLNTLDCGFCFDDLSAIKDNVDLRPESPWGNLIWNDFWGTPMHVEGSHKSYRPFSVLTFRINYLIHGLHPLGYHLGNVLLHGLVCYVFVIVCSQAVFGSGSSMAALLAGLYFAVHPVHTEAVAGVVGRAECLSALFFLLSFLAFKSSLHQQRNRTKAVGWLLFSLLLCVCSVLSKEQGITVVAVCLCYEFFIVHKNDFKSTLALLKSLISCQPKPSWWMSFLCHTMVMMGFLVMVILVRVKIMHAQLPVFTVHDNPAVALPTPYRQLHWMFLCFSNSWLLLNPSPLCADWTMGTIPLIQSVSDPRNLLTLATFIIFSIIGLYCMSGASRNQQAVLFAMLLIVFPFLPASNLLFPVGFVVAERILYVPSMGFSILVALGAHKLGRMRSKVVGSLVKLGMAYLLVCHTLKTLERNRDWHSDMTLFTSAVHTNPHNGKIYNNLGHAYEQVKNYSYAERMFRNAAAKQPDDVGAYINLGRVLKAQMRYTEAEEAYLKAVDLIPKRKTFRIAPGHINVFYNLANLVKQNSSRLEEALQLYNRALSMKPDFVEAHMNKADVLLKLNYTDKALLSYQRAVQYSPSNPDAHYNLGTVYLNMGDTAQAQKCYQTALRLNSQHTLAMFNLGLLLTEKKDFHEAARMFQQVVEIEPFNDKAYFQLGMAYIELGKIDLGKQCMEQVLVINPTYRSALYNLGLLLYQTGQYSSALGHLMTLREYHSNHVGGMQLLGDTLTHLKRLEEARKAYMLSLSHNPNHVTSVHNLGVVMAELGDFAGAVKQFARTLELDPHHKTAHRHLQGAQKMMREKL